MNTRHYDSLLLPFHRWILENDDFLAGRTSTGWAEPRWGREKTWHVKYA
jgi:hypothetical protein